MQSIYNTKCMPHKLVKEYTKTVKRLPATPLICKITPQRYSSKSTQARSPMCFISSPATALWAGCTL